MGIPKNFMFDCKLWGEGGCLSGCICGLKSRIYKICGWALQNTVTYVMLAEFGGECFVWRNLGWKGEVETRACEASLYIQLDSYAANAEAGGDECWKGWWNSCNQDNWFNLCPALKDEKEEGAWTSGGLLQNDQILMWVDNLILLQGHNTVYVAPNKMWIKIKMNNDLMFLIGEWVWRLVIQSLKNQNR